MDKEIRDMCVNAMTNGISLPQDKHIDITMLTADVWESINASERAMSATFNMYGNASKIKVESYEGNSVMDIYIGPNEINFSLPRSFGLYTSDDRSIAGWATFETLGAFSKFMNNAQI